MSPLGLVMAPRAHLLWRCHHRMHGQEHLRLQSRRTRMPEVGRLEEDETAKKVLFALATLADDEEDRAPAIIFPHVDQLLRCDLASAVT